MPGPKAENRKRGRKASPNSPNKKTRKRLDRRIDGFKPSSPSDVQAGLMFHKPGSQNRSK